MTYLYYKNDTIYTRILSRLAAKGKQPQKPTSDLQGVYMPEDSKAVISKLVSQIQSSGNPRMKVRAVLYQIYHLALHNSYSEAKDLLMKTHMSQLIVNQPVDLQILYNRAYAQIGMAAFRLGHTEEAHEILLEISSNSKHKILLAQSVSKIADKTVEFEQEERRRLIPYHMQLNLQVLESFQFICSMLIEIPRAA